MDSSFPGTFHFKVLSFFLAIIPPKHTTGKFIALIVFNLILLALEAIVHYILREEIFAFVDMPVLMVLDSASLMGALIAHSIQIWESLSKRRVDGIIWQQIHDMNIKIGVSSSSLDDIFYKDFLVMSTVPLAFEFAVILATYRTQKSWALGFVFRVYSGVTNRCCILALVYYWRYISDRFGMMAQEIDKLHGLTKIYKFGADMIVERLNQMKLSFNMVWAFSGMIKCRYEFFLVVHMFLSLCGMTGSLYFLATRLLTRQFSYAFESSLSVLPFVYTNIHLSIVAAGFIFKQAELLESLQRLSEKTWSSPQVMSTIKSFRIQLQLADLFPTVGGHLRVDSSTMILGTFYTATTYIFIFLFLN